MIACGIFTLAGIICIGQIQSTDSDAAQFISFWIAMICWVVAGLIGAGVIGQS